MGMVVRTNTMALNAYRQLGANNNAVAKSLEKLASGYRINRAGDDAAGLAISEKMKAQITGLETASANAQDGISLIQTAEGNLSEVHDMLNRMVELATKSANGTYTITEREALQDEVNALLDEIDRISQSANFNGTRLLDGSLEQGGGGTTTAGIDRIIDAELKAGEDPVKFTGVKTILDGGSSSSTKTEFVVNFKDLAASAGAAGADTTTAATTAKGAITLTFSGRPTWAENDTVKVTTAGSGTANKLELTATASVSGTDITWTVAGAPAGYKATFNGTTFTLEATAAGKKDLKAADFGAATVEFTEAASTANLSATGAVTFTDGTDQTTTPGTATDSVITVKVGGTEIATDVTVAGTASATSIATAVFNGLATAGKATIGTVNYDVVDNKDGTLTFKLADDPMADNIKGNYDWDVTMKDDTGAFKGNHTAGTTVTVQGQVGAAGAIANTVFSIGTDDIKDGTKITLDGKTVTLAVGADSKYKDGKGVVDLTSLDPDAIDTKALDYALGKISESYADGTTNFIVGVNDKSNGDVNKGLTVHKKDDSKQTYDTKAKLAGIFEITTAGKGEALTLQIGDTADSFNKMSVSVANMSTKGLKIEGLDITSEANASDAIDKIKNAINTVSTTRAGLGALQNRLEHTINNLDVAAENLSSANSRIRDTDMAKEMMNYTKMNVLVQSAQAMLAQANQQPQSVLQLLQ